MRYSKETLNRPQALRTRSKAVAAGARWLETVGRSATTEERSGAVLLVGGNSAADVSVRHAQAFLRMDQMPSDWSHAALVLDWPDGADLDEVVGVEVALQPEHSSEQAPMRNGVTTFRLSRYADASRYPNLALITFREAANTDREVPLNKVREALRAAALDPNRERTRYTLWEWLGAWHGFVHSPATVLNPLAAGMPHPAAALVEYAFEMVGVDITPGATEPNACPEMLWATARRWTKHLEVDGIEVRYWSAHGESASARSQPYMKTVYQRALETAVGDAATRRTSAKRKAARRATARKRKGAKKKKKN